MKEKVFRVSKAEEDVGKNLKLSKKRVVWKFAIDQDHYEVVLSHSMITGKKVVWLNNEIICDAKNVVRGDLSDAKYNPHASAPDAFTKIKRLPFIFLYIPIKGGSAPRQGCFNYERKDEHLCRVLIKDTLKENDDSFYDFFINGVRFADIPKRGMLQTATEGAQGFTSVSNKTWGPSSPSSSSPAHSPDTGTQVDQRVVRGFSQTSIFVSERSHTTYGSGPSENKLEVLSSGSEAIPSDLTLIAPTPASGPDPSQPLVDDPFSNSAAFGNATKGTGSAMPSPPSQTGQLHTYGDDGFLS